MVETAATPPAAVVRDVRWDDFHDLTQIYYHLYDERARGEPIGITLFEEPPGLSDEVEWFARLYRDVLAGHQITSVAEVDGHVVGNCSIRCHGPNALAETAHVAILGIIVDAPFRGRGIGEALMRHAIGRARGKFEVIRLTVFSVNERAQRLYRKLGFVHVGHQPRAIRRGERYFDEEEMVLLLDPLPARAAKH